MWQTQKPNTPYLRWVSKAKVRVSPSKQSGLLPQHNSGLSFSGVFAPVGRDKILRKPRASQYFCREDVSLDQPSRQHVLVALRSVPPVRNVPVARLPSNKRLQLNRVRTCSWAVAGHNLLYFENQLVLSYRITIHVGMGAGTHIIYSAKFACEHQPRSKKVQKNKKMWKFCLSFQLCSSNSSHSWDLLKLI